MNEDFQYTKTTNKVITEIVSVIQQINYMKAGVHRK